MPGTLIICATPIGNLGDAPPRLAEALASCDVVFVEDTRRAKKLLGSIGVWAELRSFFKGNERIRAVEIKNHLEAGATIGMLSDAGVPGISDPGVSAVWAAVEAGATITAVPGPSAVTMALAVSGMNADRFVFEGFLPRKGGERTERIDALATEPRTVVLFSATRRVGQDLKDLASAVGPDRPVVVARELTKMYEEIWRGPIEDAAVRWSDEVEPRGEFTIVLAGAEPVDPDLGSALEQVRELENTGVSTSQAVKEVATATGIGKRRLYEAALHGITRSQ